MVSLSSLAPPLYNGDHDVEDDVEDDDVDDVGADDDAVDTGFLSGKKQRKSVRALYAPHIRQIEGKSYLSK